VVPLLMYPFILRIRTAKPYFYGTTRLVCDTGSPRARASDRPSSSVQGSPAPCLPAHPRAPEERTRELLSAVGFLRVVIMPIWFPWVVAWPRLRREASRGWGRPRPGRGCGLPPGHGPRRPGFRDEAAQRRRGVVEQPPQDQVPAGAKDPAQSQAGGPPCPP